MHLFCQIGEQPKQKKQKRKLLFSILLLTFRLSELYNNNIKNLLKKYIFCNIVGVNACVTTALLLLLLVRHTRKPRKGNQLEKFVFQTRNAKDIHLLYLRARVSFLCVQFMYPQNCFIFF